MANREIVAFIDVENINGKRLNKYLDHIIDKWGPLNSVRAYGNSISLFTLKYILESQEDLEIISSIMDKINYVPNPPDRIYANNVNVADFNLVIDAIEWALSNKNIDFAIISSDRDFGILAKRLGHYGFKVYGIFENTPSFNYAALFTVHAVFCKPDLPKNKFKKQVIRPDVNINAQLDTKEEIEKELIRAYRKISKHRFVKVIDIAPFLTKNIRDILGSQIFSIAVQDIFEVDGKKLLLKNNKIISKLANIKN